MIKRAHLRQFLAVVDTGSFTAAAARVGIAQPSLSAGIAELERTVGTRLFLRERRRVRLTDAGNRLLAHARTIEREFRLAEVSAKAAAPALEPLTFGVLSSVSTAMIGRIARAYDGPTPMVLVEGSDAELRKRLGEGQLDAALTLMRPDDAGRHGMALLEEDYRVMLPSDHRLAGEERIGALEIAGETMIARRSCEILAETSRFFTQRGVRPNFFLRSANDDRCLEMVRAGMGVTTAPASLAREGVVGVAMADYDFRRTLGLIFRRDFPGETPEVHPLAAACQAAFG